MRERTEIVLPFPIKGLDENAAYSAQPELTTISCQNVRPYDSRTGRNRGGQRPGLVKYNSSQLNGTARIQDINHVVAWQTGAVSATSLGIRTLTGVAVSGGTVKTFTSSGFSAVTNGTTALATGAPVIFSVGHGEDLYFADGASYKYYDTSANAMTAWTATAGTIPADGANKPRLIDVWRGRMVLAGINTDPQNWFMSAVGDPFDWDYAPATEVETQAVAGNNAPAEKCPDKITCLIPFTDDVLIVGCDHTIYQLAGDPLAGGRFDLVSDITGMAWGRPFCKDPNGLVYFWGARGGLYRMKPGSGVERLSANRIDKRLQDVDMNVTLVRLAWDDRNMGVWIFLKPLDGTTAGTHFYYDVRTDSFWLDQFAAVAHQPAAVHVLDGDDPEDRVIILGGEDGYLRRIDNNSADDDGTAISTSVTLGPVTVETSPSVLAELQAVLSGDSGTVTFDVLSGKSFEDVGLTGFLLTEAGLPILTQAGAYIEGGLATPNYTGSLAPTRSLAHHPRVRGYVHLVKLRAATAGARWALEQLRLVLNTPKASARRAF